MEQSNLINMRFVFLIFFLPMFAVAQYQFVGKVNGNVVHYNIAIDLDAWEGNSGETMRNTMQTYTDYLIESNKMYYLQSISSEMPSYNPEIGGIKGDMITCSLSPIEMDKIELPLTLTGSNLDANKSKFTFYCMLMRYYVESGVQGYSYYGNQMLVGKSDLQENLIMNIESFENGLISGVINGKLYKMVIKNGQFTVQNDQFVELDDLRFNTQLYPLRLKWKPRGMTAKTTSELKTNYISPEQIDQWKSEALTQYERRLVGEWTSDSETCGLTQQIAFRNNRRYDENASEIRRIWRIERGAESLSVYSQTDEIYNFDTQKVERWWHLVENKPLDLFDFQKRIIKCQTINMPSPIMSIDKLQRVD